MCDSTSHVRLLHDAAEKYCSEYAKTPCNWIYRNKDHDYFTRIEASGGVMRTELKDNGGDPRSPINGQLRGLFFLANNDSGEPRIASYFGPARIQIKSDELFRLAQNLYFADFYCMGRRPGRKHYVILVMTKMGSSADMFCRQHLVSLDVASNPFLCNDSGQLCACCGVDVEVFYTEDLNITELQRSGKVQLVKTVIPLGQGHSTPGGKPKNRSCGMCNV